MSGGNDRWNYHGPGDNWPTPWTIRTPPVAQELFDTIADIVNERNQPWRLEAACRGIGPTLFYPEQHDMLTATYAQAVCDGCPVKQQCRDAGHRERWGVWGGETLTTRRRQWWGDNEPPPPPVDKPLPPINHGTHAGYQAHRRQGTMCDDCRQARNAHRQAIRAIKGWRAA